MVIALSAFFEVTERRLGSEQFFVVALCEHLCLKGLLGCTHVFYYKNCGLDHSLPLQQALQAILDLALSLSEVNRLDLLVKLLDICIRVLFEVDERLDDLDEVPLFTSLEAVDALTQLKLVSVDGLLHEGLPVAVVNFLDVELSLHFCAAILDILLVGEYLSSDELQVPLDDVLNLFVLGICGEFLEVWIKFEEIGLGGDIGKEFLHIVVCLLADDEESDAVIGIDVEEAINIRRHVFEDEHDIVTFVQVLFLVLFCCKSDPLLLFILLHQFLQIDWLLFLDHFDRLELLLLVCVSLRIDEVLIDLHISFVEVSVVVDS